MISPDGSGFIFMHRRYCGKRKYDRMIYCDWHGIKLILDEDMVSHYCWIDNECVFGYYKMNNISGYNLINVRTGKGETLECLNNLQFGDGHPTFCDGKVIVDTYPDKSRMQHLMMIDLKTHEVKQLLEVYQSVRYMNETRCDMHPRFTHDGRAVYFDSVYSGKRTLCKLNLSDIK
jgi:hypothetical protein